MAKHKLTLSIHPNKLESFISRLSDLAKVSDTIKLKIDHDDILMYAIVMAGDYNSEVIAFKNHTIKTLEYFKTHQFDHTIDFIIDGAKTFIRKLSFYLDCESHIHLHYMDNPDSDGTMSAALIDITSDDLSITVNSGDPKIMRNLSKQKLEKMLNTDLAEWDFSMASTKFEQIKKLSSIEFDTKELYIKQNSGKINASELGKWKLFIGDAVDDEKREVIFSKKYLSSIAVTEVIKFWVFERFLLIVNSLENTNLMISFENSFE